MKDEYRNINLYHGSDVKVKEPSIDKCNVGKDFGRGFYLSFNEKQATNFSKIIKRRNNSNHSIVNQYTLEDLDGLKIYEFKKADEQWLDCIINYRYKYKKESKWDKYDVLIGKIADDDTSKVISAYMSGAYGEIGSKQAVSFAVKMFNTRRLEKQICFKTNEALKHITYKAFYEDKQ